jgi:predicted transcriptional regulator
MSKAIITNWSHSELHAYERDRVRRAMANEEMEDADYILNYHDVKRAFSDITPERYRLLETLQRLGTVSIYALARELGRNYSNVHSDVSALLELELISRTPEGVSVPWEAVEWRLSTAVKAAAA